MAQKSSFGDIMKKLMPVLTAASLIAADQYLNLFASSQWGALVILTWCMLLIWIGFKYFPAIFSQRETLHWIMLNYGVPLLLIIVPILWTGFFPRNIDWIKAGFFPANGSFWVFTVLFYIIVLSELEKTLAKMQSDHPDRWDSLSLSTFCQAIIVIGAMCYVMPLIADYYGAFENYEQYKLIIAVIGLVFSTLLPAFGIFIMKKIHQVENGKDREVVYP